MKNQAAVELGKLGGSVTSERKAQSSADNIKKSKLGQKFTIRSKFHPTSINIVAELDTLLSDSQVRRIIKALCGMADCHCGGIGWSSVEGDGGDYHIMHQANPDDTDSYWITKTGE